MTKTESLYNEWKSLQPLREEDQKRLRRKFMLEFNYNSNHIEGNTLTYGQTEALLLFGRVNEPAKMKDLEDMKASNIALKMMEEQAQSEYPLTETFIRQLHKTLMREDYEEYRSLPDGTSWHYTVHAGIYKTRPNSVITPSGERFEYASPEETPALMTDLISWYRAEEEKMLGTRASSPASGAGEDARVPRQRDALSPIELATLFHFRYIRIHPFEDGNGRIARLLVNYILLRHDYPMIVVKTADKNAYLDALDKCDEATGPVPSDGAHASLEDIKPFVDYMEDCLERALHICIRAAKGDSIEEAEDFMKELKIRERQKKQDFAAETSDKRFHESEVWNILEWVFFPIARELQNVLGQVHTVFRFENFGPGVLLLSNTEIPNEGLLITTSNREEADEKMRYYAKNAKIACYHCEASKPTKPQRFELEISKDFYIRFFDDHYFVDGILNKNFAYGTYPTEKERNLIVSQFKEDLLSKLK